MASPPTPGDDTYVGLFMVEQPPDWWLPDGYTLAANGSVPIDVTAPDGTSRYAYIDPSYRPPPARVEAITDVIRRELGPVPSQGIGPETRQALGMDRDDVLGAVNRTIMAPVDLGVWLIDLANYGIDASVVAGTEGAARAGWLDPNTATDARREILGLLEIAGAESGARIGSLGTETRAARTRIAATARAASVAAAPVVMRLERATGLPFGRAFRVLGLLEADPRYAGGAQARTLNTWRAKMLEGKHWERTQGPRYEFRQLYIVKETGQGYRILDALGPYDSSFGSGPVSQKFTQLADIETDSAVSALREAYNYYRPGLTIANVPSTPRALRGTRLTGQLWLEVPVQTKPVPDAVLAAARKWQIKIRDVEGRIY